MNLRDLLRPQLVDVAVAAEDWEDAVRKAGKLLVDDEAIEPRFIDAMIQVAKDLGPYIVVAPGIALPHARPEDGVKKGSIGIMTLDPPIPFGNERNDPVFLVVTLAAIDNEQHVTGLAQMAAVLGEEDLVERIRATKDKDEILEIMLSKVDEGTET
jgi:mannitol/fructose-specific phosphotransferase system IIA component (Ntr-type)